MIERWCTQLDPSAWSFLLSLWSPLAVWLLLLKGARIASVEPEAGPGTWAALLASEGLVLAAIFSAGVLLLAAGRRHRIGRRAGRVVLAAMVCAVAIANGVSHFFHQSTGSILSWPLVVFAFERFDDTRRVLWSEAGGAPLWSLGAITAVLLFVPWLVSATQPSLRARPPAMAFFGLHALVAPLALYGAAVPPVPPAASTGIAFAREATLQLAFSARRNPVRAPRVTVPLPAKLGTHLVQADGKGGRPKHVALIVLESTRATATTLHAPGLATTPRLAALADRSLVMERAHAVVPHTSKSLVSILCGIPPRLDMRIVEAELPSLPAPCLATLLAEQGWDTAFFQSATEHFEDRAGLVENLGYEDFFSADRMDTTGFEPVNYFGPEDAVMLEPSMRWLRGRDGPTFVTYLTLTPHHAYGAPGRYGHVDFDEDPLVDRYLNSVRYLDNFVAELMGQYEALGLAEDTLFVVLGDHGEAFGEHGRFQHDNVIYQEGVHVPWLIHAPGHDAIRGRVHAPVSLLDVLPTVVELLGYRVVNGAYPGRSVRWLEGERSLPVSCWYQDRCIGVLRGDEKLIHHFGGRPDELFDLGTDPAERIDLAPEKPARTAELRREALTWRARVNGMYDLVASDERPVRGREARRPEPEGRSPEARP